MSSWPGSSRLLGAPEGSTPDAGRVRERLHAALPIAANGSIDLVARARTVRGTRE